MTDTQPPSLSLLSLVTRQAAMLVLLLHLGHLPNAQELQGILGMESRALRRHLTALKRLGLIRRMGIAWGYELALSAENRLLLSLFIPNPAILVRIWGQNVPDFPLIITAATNTTSQREDESAVIINKGRKMTKPPQEAPKSAPAQRLKRRPPGCKPELWQALNEAHIVGSKRYSLAQRADLTAQTVRLWEQYLRREKGDKYTPGLLIYVLETADSSPAANENGHLVDCECEACTFRADGKKVDIKW